MKNDWPNFPDHESLFDWNLSMKEIEHQYAPVIPKIYKKKKAVVAQYEPEEIKINSGTVMQKIAKKYPYAFSQLDSSSVSDEMWRWVYDNFLNK